MNQYNNKIIHDILQFLNQFNHPFIIQQAKERNLNVHIIGERQNLKNRRTEILVTNYENNQLKLF